jgi:hypothetical protein
MYRLLCQDNNKDGAQLKTFYQHCHKVLGNINLLSNGAMFFMETFTSGAQSEKASPSACLIRIPSHANRCQSFSGKNGGRVPQLENIKEKDGRDSNSVMSCIWVPAQTKYLIEK